MNPHSSALVGGLISRRRFLGQLSSAAGMGLISLVPGRKLWGYTAAALLPELPDEMELKALAAAALEAARAAGADFADVRIGSGRTLRVESEYQPGQHRGVPVMNPPMVRTEVGYGVRVLVGGAWGFAAGFETTADAVSRVARAAVVRARATSSANPVVLVPTETIRDGRWATPVGRSAFDVPIGLQGEMQLEALAAASEVVGVQRSVVEFGWQETERIFASTDGTMLVQHLVTALPASFAAASAEEAYSGASESIRSFRSGGYGYEAVDEVDAARELREAAERAVEVSRTLTPPLPVGVGRYDVVFSAGAMNTLVTQTLARALNAERALGFLTNRGGSSYAAPPAEVVDGSPIASALVTLRADRSNPHGHATVGWDDEGVAPKETTLIENGVVRSYLTTRETAGECAAPGTPADSARSLGCATGAGQHLPEVQLPNLTLVPGTDALSEDALVAGMERGFYVESLFGSADHQLLSAQYSVPAGRAWEVRDGRRVGRIRDMAVQFLTPQFWRNVDALGGPATAADGIQGTPFAFTRHPLQQWFSTVRTVPARVREINVLNTGRTE